jgi:hypothetical protein
MRIPLLKGEGFAKYSPLILRFTETCITHYVTLGSPPNSGGSFCKIPQEELSLLSVMALLDHTDSPPLGDFEDHAQAIDCASRQDAFLDRVRLERIPI